MTSSGCSATVAAQAALLGGSVTTNPPRDCGFLIDSRSVGELWAVGWKQNLEDRRKTDGEEATYKE